jgi:hypothetical protein
MAAERALTMTRAIPLLAGLALMAAVPGAAEACAVLGELRPELMAATPVVVRGAVTAIDVGENGYTVMTVSVAETLKGEQAETWRVAWDMRSIIGPAQTIEESEGRYGHDIVVGLVPAADGGEAALAQAMCSPPFLDAYADLEPMLHDQGLVE